MELTLQLKNERKWPMAPVLSVKSVEWFAHANVREWRYLLRLPKNRRPEWYSLNVLAATGWYLAHTYHHSTEDGRKENLKLGAWLWTISYGPRDGEWYTVRGTRHQGEQYRGRSFIWIVKRLPGGHFQWKTFGHNNLPEGLKLIWRWEDGLCFRWDCPRA